MYYIHIYMCVCVYVCSFLSKSVALVVKKIVMHSHMKQYSPKRCVCVLVCGCVYVCACICMCMCVCVTLYKYMYREVLVCCKHSSFLQHLLWSLPFQSMCVYM